MPATFAFAMLLQLQSAPSALDLADAKCMIAIASLSDWKTADAASRRFGKEGMMFFAGKIVGRSGKAAFKPASEAAMKELEKLSPDQLYALASECHDEMVGTFPK